MVKKLWFEVTFENRSGEAQAWKLRLSLGALDEVVLDLSTGCDVKEWLKNEEEVR